MEVKESKIEMDDSINKEIEALPKEMPCTSNYEDHSFHNNVEDLTDDRLCGGGDADADASIKKEVEDLDNDEVDILGCNGDNEIQVSECDDGTDGYSSSFDGTVSEHGSDETALNDQEVDSMVCNGTSPPLWVR